MTCSWCGLSFGPTRGFAFVHRKIPPVLLAAAICLASTGCLYGVYVDRGAGRPLPARPPDCELRFEYADDEVPLTRASRSESVGTLTLYHQADEFLWTEQVKEKLRPQACRIGGEVVVFGGLIKRGPGDFEYPAADFTVYRARQ